MTDREESRLTVEVRHLREQQEKLCHTVESTSKDMHLALHGRADKPGSGLLTRVHSLEESEGRRKWVVRTIGGAIAAIIGERGWHYISGWIK